MRSDVPCADPLDRDPDPAHPCSCRCRAWRELSITSAPPAGRPPGDPAPMFSGIRHGHDPRRALALARTLPGAGNPSSSCRASPTCRKSRPSLRDEVPRESASLPAHAQIERTGEPGLDRMNAFYRRAIYDVLAGDDGSWNPAWIFPRPTRMVVLHPGGHVRPVTAVIRSAAAWAVSKTRAYAAPLFLTLYPAGASA